MFDCFNIRILFTPLYKIFDEILKDGKNEDFYDGMDSNVRKKIRHIMKFRNKKYVFMYITPIILSSTLNPQLSAELIKSLEEHVDKNTNHIYNWLLSESIKSEHVVIRDCVANILDDYHFDGSVALLRQAYKAEQNNELKEDMGHILKGLQDRL